MLAKKTPAKTTSAAPVTHVLLKFGGFCNDEAHSEGFLVVALDYWKTRQRKLRATKHALILHARGNQELTWNDGKDLLSSIKVLELKSRDVAKYARDFPLSSYGSEIGPDGKFREEWKKVIFAGFGETGFLDNVQEHEY